MSTCLVLCLYYLKAHQNRIAKSGVSSSFLNKICSFPLISSFPFHLHPLSIMDVIVPVKSPMATIIHNLLFQSCLNISSGFFYLQFLSVSHNSIKAIKNQVSPYLHSHSLCFLSWSSLNEIKQWKVILKILCESHICRFKYLQIRSRLWVQAFTHICSFGYPQGDSTTEPLWITGHTCI